MARPYGTKEERSRTSHRALFDSMGMPQESRPSVFAIPPSQKLSERQRAPLTQRSPNTNNGKRTVEPLSNALSRLWVQEKARPSSAVIRPEFSSKTIVNQQFAICRLGKSVQFLEAAATVNVGNPNKGKTLGCISEMGGAIIMTSYSGMKTTAPAQEKVLDNTTWTKAVYDFCQLIGHKLPRARNDWGIEGQFKACHIEKRLMLWFVCHQITDAATGELDIEKLRELKQRAVPLQALLRQTQAACQDCMDFQHKLEEFSGIVFTIQVDKTVMQTEQYSDESVRKYRLVPGGYKPVEDIIAKQTTAGGKAKKKRGLKAPPQRPVREDDLAPAIAPLPSRSLCMVVIPLRSQSVIMQREPPSPPPQSIPEGRTKKNKKKHTPAIPQSRRTSSRFDPATKLTREVFTFAPLNVLNRRRGPRAEKVVESVRLMPNKVTIKAGSLKNFKALVGGYRLN